MGIRTDLVTESCEMHTEQLKGAKTFEQNLGEIKIRTVIIENDKASRILKREKGTYITVEFEKSDVSANENDLKKAVVTALDTLIKKRDNILVVGLGNRDITPDAIGPLTADRILATRHIGGNLRKILNLEKLGNVSALCPGVLGKTGIEAVEIIKGTVERTKPSSVIVIDALAARNTERLCKTVQFCDTGINPGSGVENSRKEISERILGVPVVAVGIPTVVDIRTLIYDLLSENSYVTKPMMVTPTDIDFEVRRSADILSGAINSFLHPDVEPAFLQSLV